MIGCYDPYLVENHAYGDEPIPVGCGSCVYCLERNSNEWSFRLMQEDKVSISAYFVTLTYTTVALPITEKGYRTLSRKHLTNYFKKLRNRHHDSRNSRWRYFGWHEHKPIKYYAVGEYGSKHKRPHYHAIIFNAHPDHIESAWDELENQDGKMVPAGSTFIGTVTRASCRYVMKYMMKDQGNRQALPYVWPCDSIPQFAVQSKHLGKSYLTPEMIQWHRDDMDRNYCVWPSGYKCTMPRYYRDKIWTTDDEKRMFIDHVRRRFEEREYELMKPYLSKGSIDSYYARLKNKRQSKKNVILSTLKKRVLC